MNHLIRCTAHHHGHIPTRPPGHTSRLHRYYIQHHNIIYPHYFPQGWAQEPMRDATLEYRLSIYHARASDSGLYTCNTPNNKSHSINIIVADVRWIYNVGQLTWQTLNGSLY